jgi:hypothetical protein
LEIVEVLTNKILRRSQGREITEAEQERGSAIDGEPFSSDGESSLGRFRIGGLETVIAGAPRWRKGTTFVVDNNLHVESIF